jgi:HK97 family phage prohead protease
VSAERLATSVAWLSRSHQGRLLAELLCGTDELEWQETLLWYATNKAKAARLYAMDTKALSELAFGMAGKTLDGPTAPAPETRRLHTETKSLVAVDAPTDLGTFTGYASTWTDGGGPDTDGDTFRPGAWAEVVEAVNSGQVDVPIVASDLQAHPDGADANVGTVTRMREDHAGLWFEARWASTPDAQLLRQKARDGVVRGLSVKFGWADGDMRPVRYPDGRKGREFLHVPVLFHIAIVQQGANRSARISTAKGASGATPIVDHFADVQARHRDPQRERLEQMAKAVAANGFPSPHLVEVLGVEQAHSMLMDVAQRKAHRELGEGDPEQTRVRARWDRENAYSHDLAEWLAAHR